MADLITSEFALAALAAGGLTLDPPRLVALPSLIAGASRAVRTFCNRSFSRATYDGLYTAAGGSVLTREYPVNQVFRVAADPTIVLTVTNTDRTTNQRASCGFVPAPAPAVAPDLPAAVSGLQVVRVAAGFAVTNEGGGPLLFASYLTVAALAAAVTALGHGWQAPVTPGFSFWPTTDPEYPTVSAFRPTPLTAAALAPQAAGLIAYVTDLAVDGDLAAGELRLGGDSPGDPFTSPRFGPAGPAAGDGGGYGGARSVRIIYDAGTDVIYEDVQQATLETVAHWMALAGGDQTVIEESFGGYAYKIDWKSLARFGLPPSAVGKLSYYRNNRC